MCVIPGFCFIHTGICYAVFVPELFIAAEKPTLSLKVNVIAGLTNAVLDYVLIVAFPLGLVGAALATAAGQLVGGIIPVIYFPERTAAYCSWGRRSGMESHLADCDQRIF